MSCIVYVEYAGMPMSFPAGLPVKLAQATTFTNEPDAWYAAYQADLNPKHCRVVPIATAKTNAKEAA